jgi:hypothetical protein
MIAMDPGLNPGSGGGTEENPMNFECRYLLGLSSLHATSRA